MFLQDKIKNAIQAGGMGLFVVVLIIFIIAIVPFLFIWTVNSLAESGGADFRLDHNIKNYFLAVLFVAIVRGGSSSNKK